MKLILATVLFCIFSVSSAFAKESLLKTGIALGDYLKIQGAYDISTLDSQQTPDGTIISQKFSHMDRFVLIYDAKKNTLIGSLTSLETSSPLILFEDLKSKYSEDKKSILLKGVGGGVLHGEIAFNIEIESGKITGRFLDGISVGRKDIEGSRKSSLANFVNMEQHYLRSEQITIQEIEGLYEGANSSTNEKIKILLREFSDGTITAALQFNQVYTYSGGVYDPDYALIEFTSNGTMRNSKLRTKVNIVVWKNGTIKVYLYGTNGTYSYYELKKVGSILE